MLGITAGEQAMAITHQLLDLIIPDSHPELG
jgi:hypothetical protein